MFYECKLSKRIIGLALILAITGSAAGCGASSAEIPAETPAAAVTSIEMPQSYVTPQQMPYTLVDQVGYSSQSEKAVIFKGEDLPESFDVISLDTGEKVYSGEILRPVYNDKLKDYAGLGYFSSLTAEGNYYIYTGGLGESYTFSISKDIYSDIFSESLKKYYVNRCGIALSENYAGENNHSACHTTMARLQDDPSIQLDVSGGWHLDAAARRDAALGSRIAETLLLAYEMNPTAFTDETGIPESGNSIPDILDEVRYEAEWLLKMQDQKTGGVYASCVTEADKDGDVFAAPVVVTPISMEATISFASMMARLSIFFSEYDQEFSSAVLKASDRAFTCYLNNQKEGETAAAFKAACSLYRATGSEDYAKILDSFFSKEDFDELFGTDEDVFLGAVTYLSINQQVDVKRCDELMKLLMKKSEDIAKRASMSGYLVTEPGTGDDFGSLLSDMRALTITDHIIYNYEYTTIIENHVHYLGGMNPEAVNYLTADTQRSYETEGRKGIMKDPMNIALLIFMISVLEQ